MAFEETREQQQMYNYFRSCIYIYAVCTRPAGTLQGIQFRIGMQGGRTDMHLYCLYRHKG